MFFQISIISFLWSSVQHYQVNKKVPDLRGLYDIAISHVSSLINWIKKYINYDEFPWSFTFFEK